MTTLNRQINESSDDCYRRLAPSGIELATLYIFCGDYNTTNYDYHPGLRFIDITIIKDAIIASAYLEFYAYDFLTAIPDTIIEGEAVGNAATFSTVVDYDGRARTTANVLWTPAAWVPGNWYTSPDIKSIIQEIVNGADWVSGNALVLFWRDALGWGGTQKRIGARSWDYDPLLAAKLEINYEVGWTGKISGVTNPAKIMGVPVANIKSVKGVE